MNKFSQWLTFVMSRWLLKWRARQLSHRLLEINDAIENGQEELSFNLCHMILTSIPLGLIALVDRESEFKESCTLRCLDVDRILAHLDQGIAYIEIEQYNNGLDVGIRRKPYQMIETRNYPTEWGEYSFGSILCSTKKRYTSAELYAALLARIGKILNLLNEKPLHNTQQSYYDRMMHVVLEDCFVLISRLVGLSLNARITKRFKQVGENQ